MARQFTGVVSSNKGDKSIIVSVQRKKNHPIYKKQFIDSRKFAAHDENNEAKIGDIVVIAEVRPISKSKRHTLVKVVERAAIQHEEKEVEV